MPLIISLSSCNKEDDPFYEISKVGIENITGSESVAQSEEIRLKAVIKSTSESTFKWYVNNEAQEVTDSVFVFTTNTIGDYNISLKCTNKGGEEQASINIHVYGKYKYGTFILNEGSVFQENSSLTFISPKGVITDSVYWKTNGTELGNASQDLFIGDGKIYFVAQNGKGNAGNYTNDGMLIIANAETLKKEVAYDSELAILSWPTHVAALGNDVFIRDNKGVYLFNTSTKELKFVEGSEGALKNRMSVSKGKVFVPANNSILVLEAGKTKVSHKIELGGAVSAVIKTADNNIYVSTPKKISKINAENYSIIKENEITEGNVSAGWGATPGISAKGDTIYYGNATTKIYRHIFNTGISEYLIDAKDFTEDAGMSYNNLAVHPISGEVYQTTIKAYGMDFLKNNISVFNFSKKEPKLRVNYKNHTHFPAGIFFTYHFE